MERGFVLSLLDPERDARGAWGKGQVGTAGAKAWRWAEG